MLCCEYTLPVLVGKCIHFINVHERLGALCIYICLKTLKAGVDLDMKTLLAHTLGSHLSEHTGTKGCPDN